MTDLAAVPDHLLAPLLESAATTLRALAVDDVPGALRPLLGFDRRGMTRGPARAQLRRALGEETHFREQTFAMFRDRPDVTAVLADWRAADALALANASALRDDLPLLASALIAATPDGVDFGLGVVVAVDAAHRRAGDDDAEALTLAARVIDLEEGLRRADAAKAALEAERDELSGRLRTERRARRERDDRAATDTAQLDRRMAELESDLARARAEAERAEITRTQASEHVAALKAQVAELQRAVPAAPPDARAIADAARVARELAGSLEKLTAASTNPSPRSDRTRASSASRASTGRRARPKLPGGLLVDSVSGADAMLRSGSVLLVVDGYNVSKTGWPNTTLEVERESLVSALHGLHLTRGTDVIVAFDGDGTQSFSATRRKGVRVVFSQPGEEADSVVVEIVAKTPLPIPVVVASSDHWVREHAQTFGAVVISSATLVAVLRKAPGSSSG